jgi:putative transposase
MSYKLVPAMKSLRRYYVPHASYFLTIVTYHRRPFLPHLIDLFWYGWGNFKPTAWVIMPDHFHVIVRPHPRDISQVVQSFKLRYSRQYFRQFGRDKLWQNRFWDHLVRGPEDFRRHLDYIHYNPVHHGVTKTPFDYLYSSLDQWYLLGAYQRDWGTEYVDYSEWNIGEPSRFLDVG